MFNNTYLENLNDLGNWNTVSANNMSRMFYHSYKLKDALGINNWNITKVTDFSEMFKEYSGTLPDWYIDKNN